MKALFSTLAIVALFVGAPGSAHANACTGKGLELQVLGSGGPEMQTGRASTSYLVWRDGKARVLVDAGGGSALRFGQSGAEMRDLDVVLLTHLHIDHVADLAALVKSSFFEDRTRSLPVLGPAGNRFFPSTTGFMRALFDPKHGAFRYLGGFLEPGQASYTILPRNIEPGPGAVITVFDKAGWRIAATTVEHAAVPALAWRIDADGHSIVFSGDANGDNGNLDKLAKGADLFVAHNAVPEGATGIERRLHMPPSVIGRIAANAEVKKLILSHRMLRTLGKEPETLQNIARHYAGPVVFADDLDCYRP